IGSKGYIGFGQDGSQSNVKKDLWEYDPTANTWTKKADCPGVARDGSSVFVLNGKAYLCGGDDAQDNLLSDFYSFDPTTNTWTQLDDLPNAVIFPATFSIGQYGYLATAGTLFGQ